jgi:hypothetical protein
VDTACGRGGLKIAPSREVLAGFLRACEGLHATGLAQALAVKLRGGAAPGGSWQEAYKAGTSPSLKPSSPRCLLRRQPSFTEAKRHYRACRFECSGFKP